jgi:hypothetical protein
MTNALEYFWTAEKDPITEEWLIRSADDDRVVFLGLPQKTCEVIAMTHNWEIQRIGEK